MAELVACPECKKHLQVPDELLGKKVQCPECKHTFTADVAEPEEANIKTSTTASKSAASKKPAWEKSDNSGSSKKMQRRDDDDEDDDDDDRPRWRRRSSIKRGDWAPHRGGMILAFGIAALAGGHILCFPFIFGPFAWYMGTGDIREMREGRMDPEGESSTQVGRILGMIASILAILYVVGVCAYFVVVFLIIGLMVGAAGGNKKFPPRGKF